MNKTQKLKTKKPGLNPNIPQPKVVAASTQELETKSALDNDGEETLVSMHVHTGGDPNPRLSELEDAAKRNDKEVIERIMKTIENNPKILERMANDAECELEKNPLYLPTKCGDIEGITSACPLAAARYIAVRAW